MALAWSVGFNAQLHITLTSTGQFTEEVHHCILGRAWSEFASDANLVVGRRLHSFLVFLLQFLARAPLLLAADTNLFDGLGIWENLCGALEVAVRILEDFLLAA